MFATLDVGEAVIYTPEGRQARRTAIRPLTLPEAAAERIDPEGPQHPIEMAVHPEQVINLPATVGVSTTEIDNEGSDQLDLRDDDQNPFEQL